METGSDILITQRTMNMSLFRMDLIKVANYIKGQSITLSFIYFLSSVSIYTKKTEQT